jgi:hypothetical protein
MAVRRKATSRGASRLITKRRKRRKKTNPSVPFNKRIPASAVKITKKGNKYQVAIYR